MIEKIEKLHIEVRWPYRDLTVRSDVAYASYMRWKGRVARGETVLVKRGAPHCLPLDFDLLLHDVENLRHGARRTAGTGLLYARYRGRVPRRELRQRIREARRTAHRERRRKQMRITWRMPGLVWSMDDSHMEEGLLHQVQDVAARYKFEPLEQDAMPGQDVADDLERLFRTYGAPMVMKIDNGSNLKCEAVMDVLAKWGVIPLLSPAYYPRYNGGIEHGVREIKEKLMVRSRSNRPGEAGLTIHELNHQPRPCLGGRTACAAFETRHDTMKLYTARKRKEVFDWIKNEQEVIVTTMRVHGRGNPTAAWRWAVETWLHRVGAIAVSVRSECYPLLPEKWSQK